MLEQKPTLRYVLDEQNMIVSSTIEGKKVLLAGSNYATWLEYLSKASSKKKVPKGPKLSLSRKRKTRDQQERKAA